MPINNEFHLLHSLILHERERERERERDKERNYNRFDYILSIDDLSIDFNAFRFELDLISLFQFHWLVFTYLYLIVSFYRVKCLSNNDYLSTFLWQCIALCYFTFLSMRLPKPR